MKTWMRTVAGLQAVLLLPAALFLASVLVGIGDPPQYDLAHVARSIVGWYAARQWTLWLLLLALPAAVLATGFAALARAWPFPAAATKGAPHALSGISAPIATLLVAGTTMMSAGVLAVVGLHMLAN